MKKCIAIRIAGYVCHKLRKKITASKLPLRGKLLLCLMDPCDEDDNTSGSADRVHAIDRGGLVRMSESTYLLFERMELIIRMVFNTDTVPYHDGGNDEGSARDHHVSCECYSTCFFTFSHGRS